MRFRKAISGLFSPVRLLLLVCVCAVLFFTSVLPATAIGQTQSN